MNPKERSAPAGDPSGRESGGAHPGGGERRYHGAKVYVRVFDEQDKIIEMGDAVRKEGDWWEFACHTQGRKILARAWDLASNHTQMVV